MKLEGAICSDYDNSAKGGPTEETLTRMLHFDYSKLKREEEKRKRAFSLIIQI
jgi:hypothetical protein